MTERRTRDEKDEGRNKAKKRKEKPERNRREKSQNREMDQKRTGKISLAIWAGHGVNNRRPNKEKEKKK